MVEPDEPDQEERGAKVRLPPPIVFVLAILLGVAVEYAVYPLHLALGTVPRVALAAVLGAGAFVLIVSSFQLFKRSGQHPKPWLPTPEIVTAGLYRFTRNPMYIALGLLQATIGVALANPWVVLMILPAEIIIYFIAIRPEEAYLESKFGDEYLNYKSSVRRWM